MKTRSDKQDLASRFWSHVDKSAGADGCWFWTGARRGKHGYGLIDIDGRTRGTHRVAFEMSKGAIAPGLSVLHSCNNPPCVNPTHLRAGTAKDNAADRTKSGRWRGYAPELRPRGERHGMARLTRAAVIEIRARGESDQRALAREFGVAQTTIGKVVRRETWRHV